MLVEKFKDRQETPRLKGRVGFEGCSVRMCLFVDGGGSSQIADASMGAETKRKYVVENHLGYIL